jgi:hypothetical protein
MHKGKVAQPVSRIQLAKALACSLTSVDKLILKGLKPAGTRGLAKLYRLTDARQLARKLSRKSPGDARTLTADYSSHAADLADRRRGLLELWLPDSAWLPAWRKVVAVVAGITAAWPARLAEQLDAVPADERDLLSSADGPQPTPPMPREYLGPDELRVLLAGPVDAHPWRPAATRLIADLAARGQGIELRADGGWWAWDPSTGEPVPPSRPAPVMRPLLQELSDHMQTAPECVTLAKALATPSPRRRPPTATGPDAARGQWRRARAEYRRVRIAIRRGHRRRADVIAAVESAIDLHTRLWWQGRHEVVASAGDAAAVVRHAARLQTRTLERLSTLDGFVPAESPRRQAARRTAPCQ